MDHPVCKVAASNKSATDLTSQNQTIQSKKCDKKKHTPLLPNVVVEPPKDEVSPATTADGTPEQHKQPEGVDKSNICNRYRNNNCEHGLKGNGCRFSHPKRCSKLMNHGTKAGKGCNLGRNCPHFHRKCVHPLLQNWYALIISVPFATSNVRRGRRKLRRKSSRKRFP